MPGSRGIVWRGGVLVAAALMLTLTFAGTASAQASRPAVVAGSTSWQLRDTLTTGPASTTFTYGAKPLAPIMGDWDGNGSRTPGTFEAGTFKLRNANSTGGADITFSFGDPRGFPVAGDWNGDGIDDVAVYRNGTWEFRYAVCGTPTTFVHSFGAGTWPATVPVAGDWDGDGTDGIGTYTLATGTWTLSNTLPEGSGPAIAPFSFWQGSGSYPVVGDWDGDGDDTVGTKRGTTWALRNDNGNGGPDLSFDFGGANDLPLSWTGESPVAAATLNFHTRWGEPNTTPVARTFPATVGVCTPLDVDDDPATDLFGTITIDAAGTLGVLVERAPGETAALQVAVEAVVTDATQQVIPRTHLAVGYDARNGEAPGTPGTFRLSAPLGPLHESPSQFDLEVSQEDRGHRIALTAGLFDGTVAERVDPSEVRVQYEMSPDEATVRANADSDIFANLTTSQPGDATFTRRLVTGADVDTATVLLQQLPSEALVHIEDSRMLIEASAPVSFVRIDSDGLEVQPGADSLVAEIVEVPTSLSVTLPVRDLILGASDPVGQLRLALSDGTWALPAFVSDAQYNANPSNTGFRDRIEVDDAAGSSAAALRLTGVQNADVVLGGVNLHFDHDPARSRPLAIDAAFPNGVAGQPETTLAGLLNKPSADTDIDLDVRPGLPIRLTVSQAAAMGSLTLNAANLGTVPQASLSLANVPTRLAACMNTDSSCRRTDRLPTALPNYAAFQSNPAQSGTAGGQNRPYPALVSMSFDDQGTSGSSSAISSMVTLNATIKLTETAAPILLTNVRFHSLSLDVGVHPTNPSFDHLGLDHPRIYMFIDSVAKPFVMNELKYPPTIESFELGTDASPATADRRLAWLPGTKCTAFVTGSCVLTGLDQHTSGSLTCGGQRQLVVRLNGLNVDLLNHGGQTILPVCSS
ncbi:MAG: hypothetical protein Q8K79_20570 [Solirubrobacteraceae bacterium]|nr:hypothetical protein [Solirubrobacteraceae bacterium]